MTATGYLVLSIGALLIGGTAFLVGRVTARRRETRPKGLTVADLMAMVVHSSPDGLVVLNGFGDVVLHNARAEELGVVRNNRVDDRARRAAEMARSDGGVIAVDLSSLEVIKGRQPQAVHATVKVLTEGFVVVDASDESESVRLEATRRDFVANVSHELKTPVGALALLAEAVLDAADDQEEVRRFSAKIMQEATRLGTLVTELIALSRLQGAEKLPELSRVEVDVVIDEAMGRSRLAAESAGIGITTDEPSGLEVEGDRTLLVTALSNLLDNAVAYSPPGSPVSVSRKLVDGFVEIAVTDRGIGIAEDQQTRVFERFYRVDKARSRATGGTGLGLAIVKHVANNHGGEVKLWSLPGTGSTFTLRIPAHPDQDEPTQDLTKQELASPVPSGTGGNHGGEL
ncbi:two-component system sensor histidine kinase SenX3 [Saccharothrix saharensis]|uniref:Sensor-like histidine kinase SenX3 n=1 Tax=Saccharothrix saharensis TaxID=571190 RepID=A0A543JHL2_9PSEU|nr:ATP-binding protein [Saccharothrix saharensis]TQM82332.1 two-component system sensor histidine kinase SenX3 [Saccharothrix saharensis]